MRLTQIWEERIHIFKTIAQALLIDSATVEDVLQETITKVLQKKRKFEDQHEAANYLRRAVINNSIDAFRKKQRYLKHFIARDYNSSEMADRKSEDALSFLIKEETIEQRSKLNREVRKAVKLLSPPQQEAISIFFDHNSPKKVKEECRRKGIPYSTARSRMLKGIDNIRKHLRGRGIEGFKNLPKEV